MARILQGREEEVEEVEGVEEVDEKPGPIRTLERTAHERSASSKFA